MIGQANRAVTPLHNHDRDRAADDVLRRDVGLGDEIAVAGVEIGDPPRQGAQIVEIHPRAGREAGRRDQLGFTEAAFAGDMQGAHHRPFAARQDGAGRPPALHAQVRDGALHAGRHRNLLELAARSHLGDGALGHSRKTGG